MSDEIFDSSALMQECDDDKDLLVRWVEMFDRDCQARMPKIREAVEADEAASLASEAHALKGGLGVLFAKSAYKSAYKLETIGQGGNMSDASAALIAFETDLKTFREAVGNLID